MLKICYVCDSNINYIIGYRSSKHCLFTIGTIIKSWLFFPLITGTNWRGLFIAPSRLLKRTTRCRYLRNNNINNCIDQSCLTAFNNVWLFNFWLQSVEVIKVFHQHVLFCTRTRKYMCDSLLFMPFKRFELTTLFTLYMVCMFTRTKKLFRHWRRKGL